MKLKKKFLSLLTAFAMTVCLIPAGGVSQVKAADITDATVGSKTVDGLTTTWEFVNANAQTKLGSSDTIFCIKGTNLYYGGSNYFYVYLNGDMYIPVTKGIGGKITVYAPFGSTSYTLTAENDSTIAMSTSGASITYSASDAEDGWIYFSTVTSDNQFKISKIVLEENDPSDTTSRVNVSGVVKSDVDISGGALILTDEDGNSFKSVLEYGPAVNQYTYSIAEVVGDGVEYAVAVSANKIVEESVLLSEYTPDTITVNTDDITDADFEVSFAQLDGVWDFNNPTFEEITIQNVAGTYKGLAVDATTSGAKFYVRPGNGIQVNTGTVISIPVSGSGTVAVTLYSDKATCTLGGEEFTGKNAEVKYDSNTSSVELVLTSNDYLYNITVTEDEVAGDSQYDEKYKTYIQYKAESDGEYTVRVVYGIDSELIDNLSISSVGIQFTEGTSIDEYIYGYSVYESIMANGNKVSEDGIYYVVVQITDVPSDAVFNVAQKYILDGNECGTTSFEVDMAKIVAAN